MRVSLHDITVRFGATLAVDRVSLGFVPGEVHAVLGENGAGKSTLMNALFGLVQPAAGRIEVNGQERRWRDAREAIAAGLGMVHQHFMLQDSMTVLENVVLCAEPVSRFGWVDFAAARRRLDALEAAYGFRIDLDARVERLSVGQRQLVEILKLLYRDAAMLILDEPTAVLTPQEKDRLFAILRAFRAEGRPIALITHKLDEVMELADRVSVMRAGRLISSGPVAETSRAAIARDIVGGQPAPALQRGTRPRGAVALEVAGLRAGRMGPVDFRLHAGEIVGIAGVSGNGQAELVEALVGLRPAEGGRVTLAGQDVTAASVARRRAAGLCFIPEDRQRVGLALEASVAENAGIGREGAGDFRLGPFLNRAALRRHAAALIERYRIRVAGPGARAGTMSGGNKQKLVVARELGRDAPVILAENPTWGVDIGAIAFIHGELMRMRDAGRAILMVSTELDEILALSDRILVMYAGRISAEFAAGQADRHAIGARMVAAADIGLKAEPA